MLNFLKKKSKTVFLFFFTLLLPVTPLLNLSATVYAESKTWHITLKTKDGDILYDEDYTPSGGKEPGLATGVTNRDSENPGPNKIYYIYMKDIKNGNVYVGPDTGFEVKASQILDDPSVPYAEAQANNLWKFIKTVTVLDSSGKPIEGEGYEYDSANGSTDDKQIEKKCKKQVGALGWILCPITLGVAKAVSNTFTDVQENFIAQGTSIMSNPKLSETWGNFRNWSNIIFIILFFIIILSQLTGVGIDNYGIKRILPRLVVSAILINLSFVICQLAVDVSNIIGKGLTNLFAVNLETTGVDGTYIPIDIGGGASGEIRISLEGVGGAGLLLVILLCLVIALLAIIILWVFCLARNIGIAVVTCLAPLAFAANLLPNTEGFFKKWWSLSKILLVLYPICALTVGAGIMVSRIISSLGTQWLFQLGAVLAAVLPFVAIPYLLLNMLSAFGTIGSKISNWGRGKLNAGWRAAGRPVSSTTKMAARGAARVAGSVAGLPLGITKDALKKVSQSGAGKSVSGAVKKYNPGALSQKVGKAYSKTKFGSSETGKAVSQLVNAPVSAVKDTAKEAFESTKYAIKKPFADTAKADAERRIERTNIDNWTNPVRRAASEAAMTSKQQADDIKARESLIQSDRYSYRRRDASGNLVQTTLDHSSITQLGEALRYVMSKNYTGSESDRKSDIAALNNRLFALGDKGRTESANAYNYVTTTTDANGNTLASRDGVLAYGQNVMDYHAADAKQNQRAIYEVASRVVSDNASNATTPLPLTDIKLSDFAGRTAGKLKLEQYATMDDIEVERIEQAMNHQNGLRLTNGGTQAEEDAAKAATLQAIHSALNDKQISSMLKGERRVKLQQILDDHSGQFTPLQQEPTRVLVVNHGNQQGSQGNGANNGGGGANP